VLLIFYSTQKKKEDVMFKMVAVTGILLALILAGGFATLNPGQAAGEFKIGLSAPLTGDWAGHRIWLKEHGITLAPRLTQFYEGLTAGDADGDFKYGGKADLLLNADLSKLGFWNGFSVTVHAEYNFGESINGAGGTLVPVNTALVFPGMKGADAFDLSSVYFQQQFSDSVSLLFGKINMMDIAARTPFKGGAGIDAYRVEHKKKKPVLGKPHMRS
jgi:porin